MPTAGTRGPVARKKIKGECKTCGKVDLRLRWRQTGPDAWKLLGSCPVCRTELGIVKQTQQALEAAPEKVPQTFLFDDKAAPGGPAVTDAS